MKNAKKYIKVLRLNQKMTLFVIVVLVIPIIGFSTVTFNYIEDVRVSDKIKDIKLNMAQSQSTIQKNVEMCNMSTQVFLNSKTLIDWACLFKEEKEIAIEDKLKFYKNDIASLEKIVNSNPYLYQIRVYIDSPTVVEMMPILYSYNRLENLSWSKDKDFKSGTWQFDYEDSLFSQYVYAPTKHIVSLVTEITSNEYGRLGVIEVATRMELLFPQIYHSTNEQWACFIDDEGEVYADDREGLKWSSYALRIFREIKDKIGEGYYEEMEIGGESVIVASQPVKELDGYLLKIVSLKEDRAELNKIWSVFLVCLSICLLLVIILISRIIKIMLKRLYKVISTVRQVGNGDLNIRVPEGGEDEIGELGHQINRMLSRISGLMEESIKRERLVKDSEIRALQNQINAHFIYNVLESVKMMAEIEERYDISDALTSLGKLLRYSMRWVKYNVTIEEEIDYIKNYLALINLRFDYKIILSISMSEEILKQAIPKMSLQPIIENAIYHGIEELAEDTTIYIKGSIKDKYCLIEITDSGVGMTEEEVITLRRKIAGEIETKGSSGNGLGLKNVQDRIKMNFGKEYGISVTSKEKCYTKVIVKIPYKVGRG